jgi:hypothetical protein
MRDLAHDTAARVLANVPALSTQDRDDLADLLFAFHCEATTLKYEDRVGRKGDPADDRRKADWYRRMLAHVRGDGPDPRAERADFVPYRRPT